MLEHTAIVALLKKCAQERDICKGIRVHSALLKVEMLRENVFISNALICMYAKCGAFMNAQRVFDGLPARDIISWTSLITAYSHAGHAKEALDYFERLKCEGLSPDAMTLSSVVKACGDAEALGKGKEIHAEIVGEDLLRRDVVLGNALVDMYAKCGALSNAQELFNSLLNRDVVSWTALVVGYCQHGHYEKALSYYERMQKEGPFPNAMTMSCILKACGSMGAIEKGMQLHKEVLREGSLRKNVVLGTALFNMYIMCGALEKAQEVFDALGGWDIVSWTALIAGYYQHGHDDKAIVCFERMQNEGFHADTMTLGTVLQACGSIGAVEKGNQIHAEILGQGSFGRDVVVGNALVDMYAKCGCIAKAQQIFDELPVQNLATWTALIAGYGKLGMHNALFKSFNKLLEQGVEPDQILFSTVLNACKYISLVCEGETYFAALSASYCGIPTLEHYTDLVTVFGHAGHLDKAMAITKNMPFSNHSLAWFALLGACRKWGNLNIGELAFRQTYD